MIFVCGFLQKMKNTDYRGMKVYVMNICKNENEVEKSFFISSEK